MRNKNGFTLVELLATIVILGLIILAATPAVLSIASKIRTSMYCTKIEMVKKAGQMYGQENALTAECFVDDTLYTCESLTINDLIENDYIIADGENNVLTDPRDKSSMNNTRVMVYSKYNKYYAAVPVIGCGDITSVSVGRNIVLTLNGGTLGESLPTIIGEGDEITLTTPVKSGYLFTEWTVSGEGSSINNNILTVGSETIYLTANWTLNSHTLTINADGGTWSGTNPQTIDVGNSITISAPVKTGHIFSGWTLTGTGSTLNGTTFTMGSEDATLTANWLLSSCILTVNANGGTWVGTTPQTINVNNSVTINYPYRTGYVFTGWNITGTGSTINGTTFTMGTSNTTITANWVIFASMYTYTGSSTIIDDGSGNWRIKFLTSGTFTPLVNMTIDAFLVGGGGGGGTYSSNSQLGGGGGGGYTGTFQPITLTANQTYSIIIGGGGGIGASGGVTSGFGNSVNGGLAGSNSGSSARGGNGGSGGGLGQNYAATNGGSDGSSPSGTGQGTTTKEFGETAGTLYSGGGGGGNWDGTPGTGGSGGGGNGAKNYAATAGTVNTGGGGGGRADAGAAGGGSGILVIRNHR